MQGGRATAIWEPFDRSAEVYWSQEDGSIRGVRRTPAGWSAPFYVNNKKVAEPNAMIAIAGEPVSGALHVYWSKQDGSIFQSTRLPSKISGVCTVGGCWSDTESVSAPGSTRSGAMMVGLWEPAYRQFEILGATSNGLDIRSLADKVLPSAITTAWFGDFNRLETIWIASGPLVQVELEAGRQ